MTEDLKNIRRAAIALLARREYSKHELREKLALKYQEKTLIDQVLTNLASEGLQSDERFLESFIRYRANKGFGPMRIAQALQVKGISLEISHSFLWEYDWMAVTEDVLIKYAKKLTMPHDFNSQLKTKRFLYYRGFTSELIEQAMKARWKNHEYDDVE